MRQFVGIPSDQLLRILRAELRDDWHENGHAGAHTTISPPTGQRRLAEHENEMIFRIDTSTNKGRRWKTNDNADDDATTAWLFLGPLDYRSIQGTERGCKRCLVIIGMGLGGSGLVLDGGLDRVRLSVTEGSRVGK